ncbi:MAG: hypothetical protein JO372_25240 [Solirubrobacterales bacterium]|nr:hypothetical protein [Solirubrobacterales bacterium]
MAAQIMFTPGTLIKRRASADTSIWLAILLSTCGCPSSGGQHVRARLGGWL